jgi:hypothetical protein
MRFAETEVTVGDEGTHAAWLGKRQCLAVVAIGLVGAADRGNVTVETERMCLASAGPKALRKC